MIIVSFETKKDQKAILDEAAKYFVDKVGLKLTERNSCCVSFGDHPSNYVNVTLSQKDERFEVIVESKEFEYWAKKFVEEFKGKL